MDNRIFKFFNILVVEDDEIIRDLLHDLLKNLYKFNEVFTARDGMEGLEKFKTNKIDVIVTDIRMPILDGIGMSKAIREIDEQVPIIAVSAFEDIAYLRACIEIGVKHFILKPVKNKYLYDILYKEITFLYNQNLLKENELKLINQKKILTTITNSLSESLIMTDSSLNIIFLNPTANKLLSATEGENINDYLETKLDSSTFVFENDLTTKELKFKNNNHLLTTVTKITRCFSDNHEERFIFAIEDISNLLNYKMQLHEKDLILIRQSRFAAMGEMINMIAHQWRQPISTIGMICANILVDIELESITFEDIKYKINSIEEHVQFLSQTIDDFRNFFATSNKEQPTNTTEIIEQIISIVGKSLENNNIKFIIENSSKSTFLTFKSEIIQVLLNLVANSKDVLKSIEKENKFIKFIIKENESSILFEIVDNGTGIDDSLKHKIFEPYFSTKYEKNGTGIGLYMSKSIVEQHLNGKIWFENIDGGVAFKMEIPIKRIELKDKK